MANRKKSRQLAAPRASLRPSPPPSVAASVLKNLAACAIVAAAVWTVYGRAVRAPFIFDDIPSIVEDPSIVKLWPLAGDSGECGPLKPTKDSAAAGRPLVNLSLAVNYYLGHLDPLGYHVYNVVLHMLSAMLLYAIVRRTLALEYFAAKFDRAAWVLAVLVAIVWAVHPLQTEAVEYTVQRTELMVGFFYLATLLASLGYFLASSPAGRIAWLVLASLACACGMACKEVMVSAPVAVLLFERAFIAGSLRQALRQSWPLYIGLGLGWLLLLALNYDGPRATSAGFHLGVPAYVWWLTQTKVFLVYLRLAVWPWPLAIYYEVPYLNTLAAAWPYALPVAALLSVTLILLWRNTAAGFVGAWFFMILSPTLIVPIVTEVAAERRMYLPLAALVAAAIIGVYELAQKGVGLLGSGAIRAARLSPPVAITVACGLLLALALAVVSVRRLAAYDDVITLWEDGVAHQPDNVYLRKHLSVYLVQAGRTQEALEHLAVAARLAPADAYDIYLKFGYALANAGQLEEAIKQYEAALRLKPDFAEGHSSLGVLLAEVGRTEEAMAHYKEALRLNPQFGETRVYLGIALGRVGRPEEAIGQYQEALRLRPDLVEAHMQLGVALVSSGHFAEAIPHFQDVLRRQPELAAAHNDIGFALASMGRSAEAIEHFQQALRSKPNMVEVYPNLARAYEQQGRASEAIRTAEEGLALARSRGQTTLVEQIEAWLTEHKQASPKP
jgi:tetratricopeptide (TPR) repeat protein